MTEEDKLLLAQPLTDIYVAMETDLMKAIAEQLAFDGGISPSSEWRLRKLAEAGALTNIFEEAQKAADLYLENVKQGVGDDDEKE